MDIYFVIVITACLKIEPDFCKRHELSYTYEAGQELKCIKKGQEHFVNWIQNNKKKWQFKKWGCEKRDSSMKKREA